MFAKLAILAASLGAVHAVQAEAEPVALIKPVVPCECTVVDQQCDPSKCLDDITALQEQILTGTATLQTALAARKTLIDTSFKVFGLPLQSKDEFQTLIETLWTTGLAQGETLIVPVFPLTEETRMDCDKLTAPYRQRINDIYMQISENQSRTAFLTEAYCRDLETKLIDLRLLGIELIRALKKRDDVLAQLIFDAGNDLDGTVITQVDADAWLTDAITAARAGTLNGQDTSITPKEIPEDSDLGTTLCAAVAPAPPTATDTAFTELGTVKAELIVFLQLVARLEEFAREEGLLDEEEQ